MMEMQNMEQSQNSLTRLNAAVEELVAKIKKQQDDFQSALAAEKEKQRNLQNELAGKEEKLSRLQEDVQNLNNTLANRDAEISENVAKIAALENASGSESEALRNELAAKTQQYDDLNLQYQQAQQKLEEMHHTISQTSENIDSVVARLEKVLEENGAGDNNN